MRILILAVCLLLSLAVDVAGYPGMSPPNPPATDAPVVSTALTKQKVQELYRNAGCCSGACDLSKFSLTSSTSCVPQEGTLLPVFDTPEPLNEPCYSNPLFQKDEFERPIKAMCKGTDGSQQFMCCVAKGTCNGIVSGMAKYYEGGCTKNWNTTEGTSCKGQGECMQPYMHLVKLTGSANEVQLPLETSVRLLGGKRSLPNCSSYLQDHTGHFMVKPTLETYAPDAPVVVPASDPTG